MIMLLLALPLMTAAPSLQTFQDSDGNELRFHRVHLRNGNFIDGTMMKDSAKEVVLKLRSGEMSIPRDQIDRVEFIKMKGRPDQPTIIPPPKLPVNPTKDPVKDPIKNPLAEKTPAEIRKKVDMMVWKLRTSPGEEKEFPLQELAALGDEGAMYLAARMPDIGPKLQTALTAALINLKNPKVLPVVEGYLTHESGAVRAMAVTVIGVLSEESQKAGFLKPLLRDSDPSVRGTVLGLLGSTQDADLLDPLLDLSADSVKEIRNQALTIAARLAKKSQSEEKLLRTLVGNLRDPNEGVRADTIMAIAGLGKSDAWNLLSPLLSDSSAGVRTAAAGGLMNLAVPDSGPDIVAQMTREREKAPRMALMGACQRLRLMGGIEPLIEWLGDPDEDLRRVVAETLRGLTGEALGTDRDKWAAWWAANKK